MNDKLAGRIFDVVDELINLSSMFDQEELDGIRDAILYTIEAHVKDLQDT